jgi:tetratricopeptide (TPR) repeat protein
MRNLAAAALRSGNVAGARQMLHDLVAEDPGDADALQMLAEIAVADGALEQATVLLRRAVAADPSTRRRIALVLHLQRFARPAVALQEIEQLPQAVRDEFEIRSIEAALLGVLGMHERQIGLYKAMARERPSQPALWVSLGNALKTFGRAEEAVTALRRALKAAPAHGDAWWTLANFKSFKFSASDVARMREALRGRIADDDSARIHFALGKAYEDRGKYEESFAHYAAGNEIRARDFAPGDVGVSKLVDESITSFDRGFFERNRDSGCPEEGPIFVVGLNRSGSTLIEQILASHPLVEGTTELVVMKSISERIARTAGQAPAAAIAALEPPALRAIGEEYLERTPAFRQTDRPYFVDKMPANWTHLPLIRAALPNARIVDARRHPLACGFSNFKQYYASGAGFSYRLESIGRFYRDYWRFMRHFESVQPGVVCRMINEQLIDEPEQQVRRLLDHLGLPFEPSCLEFYKNERAVRTPSAEQVRRPINREGVDSWRHFESWLGELKNALGPALESWAE